MKKIVVFLLLLCFMICFANPGLAADSGNLRVITTISILANFVENIGGENVMVDYLVPRGEEPEEYEPIPGDFRKLSDADLFVINGLNIESWVERFSGVTDTEIITATEGAPTIPLLEQDIPDPHLWLDVNLVIDYYLENILEAFITVDPKNEELYKKNTELYRQELRELDQWIRKEVKKIPEKNRIIISSESAFKYLAAAYGFQSDGIWELNSHEEGTPRQIMRIINLVDEKEVPALFMEMSITPRHLETISRETGVPVIGPVYTDCLGFPGSEADTYIKMMKYNISQFVGALK